jgi:hypothetical protein
MNKNFLILSVTTFALVLASLACGSTPRTTTTVYESTPTVNVSDVVPPVASKTSEPQPTATLEPQINLEMGSYTSYRDSIGTLWFVGEILNKGNASAESIDLALSLLDDNNNVAAVGSTNLSFIQSNGKFPFKIMVDNAPQAWKDVKIQIQGGPSDSASFMPPYVDFKTTNVNNQPSDFGGFSLTGTVTNTGQKTATLVNVVAAIYDKDGKVIDVADTFTALTDIAPGGDSPFSIDFLNITGAPTGYGLFVVSFTK